MRAVFFDSGGTLARPLGGAWWPKPRLRELIAGAGLPVPDDDRLRAAEAAAPMPEVLTTLDEELTAYVDHYRAVLGAVLGTVPAGLAQQLAEAAVFELDQEPFLDTVPTLRRLAAAGVRLGVVSNAAPSLELRHRDMGIRDFFDPFVISAVVGCAKPDRRIYQLALASAALVPSDVVFVDDVAENVLAAVDAGMTGYLVDRDRGRDLTRLVEGV